MSSPRPKTTAPAPTGDYHVAVSSVDLETGALTTTYLGTVDQDHVDQVRQIAALDDPSRWLRESCRTSGAFFVLRSEDDGTDYDLDAYVPVGAPPFVIRTPDSGAQPAAADQPRGVSGPAWIDGVVRFGDGSIGGAMDHPESGPRGTWHTTESPQGGVYFAGVAAYLIAEAVEPQVIYDPPTDRLGQFGPLTQSGRALRNDGARRTNREGTVNIQTEVLARAANPWTVGFDKSKKPNFNKLLAAMRAHGIPDDWPAGAPPKVTGTNPRSRTVWQSKPGHYGHSQVPGNDHDDPGNIDTGIVPGKPGGTNPTPPAPNPGTGSTFPGASQFGPGANNANVTCLGTMLMARGGKRFYAVGPGPKWGDADKNATAAFQKAQGWTGSDADGIPGPTTWDLLVTGKGKNIPAAPAPATQFEPFPGAAFFHTGRNSPIVLAMGRRLVAEGCSDYQQGPSRDWTNADKRSFAKWQRKYSNAHHLNWSAEDCNGIPGKASWDALHVLKSL